MSQQDEPEVEVRVFDNPEEFLRFLEEQSGGQPEQQVEHPLDGQFPITEEDARALGEILFALPREPQPITLTWVQWLGLYRAHDFSTDALGQALLIASLNGQVNEAMSLRFEKQEWVGELLRTAMNQACHGDPHSLGDHTDVTIEFNLGLLVAVLSATVALIGKAKYPKPDFPYVKGMSLEGLKAGDLAWWTGQAVQRYMPIAYGEVQARLTGINFLEV